MAQRLEKADLFLPLLVFLRQKRRLSRPRAVHGGRGEGKEGGLPKGEGLSLGGLGVAELEVEGGAGEAVGYAGGADDDGAATIVAGDDAIGDGLVVSGAEVGGLEGTVGRRVGRGRRLWFLLVPARNGERRRGIGGEGLVDAGIGWRGGEEVGAGGKDGQDRHLPVHRGRCR